MDVFEKHFMMLKKNEEIFKKYSIKKENGIKFSADKAKDFYKSGKNLLSIEVIEYFLEVRSIHYHNIINLNLNQYSFPEWIVCLEENVLLDYALPIFSRVLQEYPMLCGMQCEWQVLYEITKINEDFWMIHQKWKEYFIDILNRFCSNYVMEELIDIFSEEYFFQFEKFMGKTI